MEIGFTFNRSHWKLTFYPQHQFLGFQIAGIWRNARQRLLLVPKYNVIRNHSMGCMEWMHGPFNQAHKGLHMPPIVVLFCTVSSAVALIGAQVLLRPQCSVRQGAPWAFMAKLEAETRNDRVPRTAQCCASHHNTKRQLTQSQPVGSKTFENQSVVTTPSIKACDGCVDLDRERFEFHIAVVHLDGR